MAAKNLEDVLKTLTESITQTSANINSFSEKFDGRFKSQDERLSLLEKSILEGLVRDHGPQKTNLPAKRWSWARLAAAMATKDWKLAPFEKEEIDRYQETVEKTMYANTYTAGGSLIPVQYINELIDVLRGRLILDQLGVRVLTGLTSSPVSFPKVTTGLTGYWVAEGASITASDLTTGRLDLQPHKVAALAKLSNEVVLLSNPSIEASVRADIVNALREKIEKAAFTGTGLLGEPLGLDNWSPAINAGTYTTSDVGTKAASFRAMLKLLDDDNIPLNAIAWAMDNVAYWVIQSYRTATEFIPLMTLDQTPATGNRDMLCGYPIFRSTNLGTSGTVYCGNWEDMLFAIWSQMEVSGSLETSTAFEKDELWIRALMRVDIGVRRAESFASVTGVTS